MRAAASAITLAICLWSVPVQAQVQAGDAPPPQEAGVAAPVRAQVANLLNSRHRFERTVWDGRRLRDPVLYHQSNNQLIGPIFQLLVKGDF